jgi:hypothetical protein
MLNEFLSQTIGLWEGIVAEEADDRGHAPDLRNGGVHLPVVNAGLVGAPLKQARAIGRASVSAYQLEHIQQWCGCAISEAITGRFPEIAADLRNRGLIIPYLIPMKSVQEGVETPSLATLNWCVYAIQPNRRRSSLNRLLGRAPDESSRQRISKTVAFVDEMKRRKLESSQLYAISIRNLN